MAEYVTCPACGLKVLTADSLVGRQVRCYGCDARFLAEADPPAPPPPPRPPPAGRREAWPSPAPPRFRGDEDDDEENWPFCPGCGRQVSWDDLRCPHCGEEFEEEDAPRPMRPLYHDDALPVRRDGAPHLGGLLFALGGLSAVISTFSPCFAYIAIVSVPLGVFVWVLAARDLGRMRDGSIDPSGRILTRFGHTAAMLGVGMGILSIPVYLLLKL